MNSVKEIDIKNCTYYFFNDMINIKNLDPNKIKIDEQSNTNIFIYWVGYVTVKNVSYVKINSVNPLYCTDKISELKSMGTLKKAMEINIWR